MTAKHFVDTNILIYAYDKDAGAKHSLAVSLLRSLWELRNGVLSTQVFQEFYVHITRKRPQPISPAVAPSTVDAYRVWQVEVKDLDTVRRASDYEERHQLSFWDAMIVAAAVQGCAVELLTEDLTHGQSIDGVQIRKPFVKREFGARPARRLTH